VGVIFFILAAILFFFEGAGVTVIPKPVTWGLFCLALGLAVGSYWPVFAKRSP